MPQKLCCIRSYGHRRLLATIWCQPFTGSSCNWQHRCRQKLLLQLTRPVNLWRKCCNLLIFTTIDVGHLLHDIKLLFRNEEAANNTAWLHDELFTKCAHSLTRKINGEIFKTWQALRLYAISTYEELISNNEGSWYPYCNSILTMSTALEYLDNVHKSFTGPITS